MPNNHHYSWTAAFILLFGLVQIVLPAFMLSEPRPARFGWHMFTQGRTRGDFAVVHADGTRTKVRIADYAVSDRPEVDFHAVLPAHLCRVIPEAQAIAVKGATGMRAEESVTTCR